jgi:C-terminal processing protease CtpA/Prc
MIAKTLGHYQVGEQPGRRGMGVLVERAIRTLLFLTFSVCCLGQEDLPKVLSFETEHPDGRPGGWRSGPPGTLFVDEKVVHSGRWAARLDRTADSTETFSTLTRSMPIDFTGTRIELRGWLKMENVSGMVGLWLREDAESGSVAFDNMTSQQLKGTHDWAQYSVSIPFRPEAKALFYGFLISGTGKAWADDLELLVDGKPVWEAPRAIRSKTILDQDHEFDAGSGMSLSGLSSVQVENLVLLGRVWGFLKYHHPEITNGRRHWDFDLFRVMPAVVSASNRTAATVAMQEWIGKLGDLAACNPCAKLDESDLHLRPEFDWIGNEALLGKRLSASLKNIYANRHAGGNQFYVSQAPDIGNPVFDNEKGYVQIKLPDAGYQLLALYRFWNIINYWFPYRDVIGGDWDGVLAEFVPRLALANTPDRYQLELMALIARANDTHANLWGSLQLQPPVGECQLPVIVRFVENNAVVTGYSEGAAGAASGLKAGDVVMELDSTPVSQLIDKWRPYYAASNEPTRLRDIARSMTRGACSDVMAKVRRESESVIVKAQRVKPQGDSTRAGTTHDLPGEAFQVLPENVAYLKLSAVKGADAAEYVKKAAGTKGWIIDIRNYPSEFVVFSLGQLLVEKETPFVRFTFGDLANPGAFHWRGPALSLIPREPHYSGKLAILVDEVTLSQAEYTTMAFRVAPGAVVIGSTTAAADGNVSPIPLPGGLRSLISGIGVFYPDKRPTQRVGIVPDIEVKPTIAGVRTGKDEVLEAALRWILAQR